jgi:hypothetical protein
MSTLQNAEGMLAPNAIIHSENVKQRYLGINSEMLADSDTGWIDTPRGKIYCPWHGSLYFTKDGVDICSYCKYPC